MIQAMNPSDRAARCRMILKRKEIENKNENGNRKIESGAVD